MEKVAITIDELRALPLVEFNRIKEMVNIVRQERSQDIKQGLQIGDKVKVNHQRHIGKVYIVQKINNKNVKCKLSTAPFTLWTISPSLLEKI